MSDGFKAGDRVEVGQAFGLGTVIRETDDGVLARLDDPEGMVIEWRKDDTRLVEAAPVDEALAPEVVAEDETTDDASLSLGDQPEIPPEPVEATPVQPGAERQSSPTKSPRPRPKRQRCLDAVRAIDALRFGVVPATNTEQITLGYEELKTWVLRNLPQPPDRRPMVSEVAGPFGTGKSHAMATVRHVAHEAGYLTTTVEVDGEFVSLSQPKELLSALLPTLGGAELDSHSPAVELTTAVIKARNGWVTPELRRCERVAANTAAVRELQEFGRWEEHEALTERLLTSDHTLTVADYKREVVHGPAGVGTSIYYSGEFDPMPLVGHRVASRGDDFAKALLGYALLASDAGHKGLVVTIDEFEIEHLSRSRWNRVAQLINSLASHVNSDTAIVSAPLAVFIATVGQEGHVGDAVVEALVGDTPGDTFALEEWSVADRLVLAQRIHGLYFDAYPEDEAEFSKDLVADVEADLEEAEVDSSGFIRAFIKRYVLALDSRYGPSQIR